MITLPVTFESKEEQVYLNKIYDCEFCRDSKEIESYVRDSENGYLMWNGYKLCKMCV